VTICSAARPKSLFSSTSISLPGDRVHRALERVLLEELRDLDGVGYDHERADLREQVLRAVHEVQPEAGQVAGGQADGTTRLPG
jgi:hypothetical protein